jgi:hypothetical protein
MGIGMVCDALFSDFDNDGWQDLVLVGEWMTPTFLKNVNGQFKYVNVGSNVSEKVGWWTSISSGDFDNDGDVDYIAGNLGLNSFYKTSPQFPVNIYGKDFNSDGNFDAITTVFLPSSPQDHSPKEYPAHVRDDMTKQMISFKSKFQNYRSYANGTWAQMFSSDDLKDAVKLQANYFDNAFIRNDGDGKFEVISLPVNAQFACINGMVTEDINDDGNLDVVLNGNDYGTDVSIGRYDACNGLTLLGDGKGNFTPQSILQSGIYIPGNGKALVKLTSASNEYLVASSENKGPLKMFKLREQTSLLHLTPGEISMMINYKDGKRQKVESGYGSSFLSQSGRFLKVNSLMSSIQIQDSRGRQRIVKF